MNYIAIILAAVLYFVLGKIWYGSIFGRAWRKETHRTGSDKPTSRQFLLVGLFALMLSTGTSLLIESAVTLLDGLVSGLLLGLLIVMPIVLSEHVWDKKSTTLVLINAGFYVFYLTLICGLFTFFA